MACSSAEKTLELVVRVQAFSNSNSGMTTAHDVVLVSEDLDPSVYPIRVEMGWSSKRESKRALVWVLFAIASFLEMGNQRVLQGGGKFGGGGNL
jgi:hypothetical protein